MLEWKRRTGRLAVLLMPLALTLMSLGQFYAIFGAMIFATYSVFLSFPAILRAKIHRINRPALAGYLLLFLSILGYCRATVEGNFAVYKMIALSVIWIMVITGLPRWRTLGISPEDCWRSLQIFVAINIVGLILHIPPPSNPYDDAGQARILGLLGIEANRVLFPFALGVNGFGVIAGLATVVSVVFFHKKASVHNFLYLVTCLSALLLSDSRGALGFTVLTLFVYWVAARIQRKKFSSNLLAISLVCIYPVLTFIIYKTIDWLLGDISTLVRAGGGVLSGRDVIWEAVYDQTRKFDALHWIFGWGYLGQMQSKASEGYVQLFNYLDNINPEQMNVHSSFLQLLLDWGAVGVISLSLINFKKLRSALVSFGYSGYTAGAAIFAFITYAILAGALDITLNQANLVFFYFLLVVSSWGVLDPDFVKFSKG